MSNNMNKKPKVSIIIPVYNGSNYISKAIDSALNQDYDNIEIIVVNDGSKDRGKTRSIAMSYGDKIKYIEKPNGGVSSALNTGIKNMTGDYFSWLSHDDLYKENKVSRQIEEISKYDADTILYSNYDIINEEGIHINDIILNHEKYNKNPLYSIIDMKINGITLLIPKKAFDECGFFDEELRCVQDYDLWLKMIKKYKFIHMNDILGSTRVHPMQVSNTSNMVIMEGNAFYENIIDNIDEYITEYDEGSKYLFFDVLQRRMKFSSPYNEVSDYIETKKYELLKCCKIDTKKILWLIDANKVSYDCIKEYVLNNDCKNVVIVTYGKKTDICDFISDDTQINADEYNYVYMGNQPINFDDMLRKLVISDATIIGDYLLEDENISVLDKYSLLLHLNYNSSIFRNNGVTISKLKKSILLYIFDINNFNVLLNSYTKSDYNFKSDELSSYLKGALNANCNSSIIANICYQIAVIYNRQASLYCQEKIIFYEPCKKYNDLKYSRAWKLYSKMAKVLKGKKII